MAEKDGKTIEFVISSAAGRFAMGDVHTAIRHKALKILKERHLDEYNAIVDEMVLHPHDTTIEMEV